jgi:hypothetical protein
VASDTQGNFYYAHIAENPYFYYCGSDGRTFIRVAKSTDNGFTFSTAVDASPGTSSGELQDKPWMAIDRANDNIYVCWTSISAEQILFTNSTDHGQSFGPNPPTAITSANTVVQGCSIAVGPTGYVYVGWNDQSTTPNHIRVRRSTNGGSTWGPTVTVGAATVAPYNSSCGRSALNGPFVNDVFANLAADATNSNFVYAVWQSYLSPYGSEILFNLSTDGGQSWAANPLVLNDDATATDQFQPQILTTYCPSCFTGNNLIRVAWYDRRRDTQNNKNYDVYATLSADRGQTWQANQRWTDTADPLPLPQLQPSIDCVSGRKCRFGDYLGLAGVNPAANTFYMVGFRDTRLTASGVPCASGYPASSPDTDIREAVGS